jgi:hypothetical protein
MYRAASTPIVLIALAASAGAQELVVPANQVFAAAGISGLTWRTTAFRFQMMYDNALFTGAGVTGPITIGRLRFRGEDAEANSGGQVYSNVTVRLYDAPTAAATVVTGAAAGPAASTTTSIAATGLTSGQFAGGASDPTRPFSLTFTSGANTGLTRVISANTATTITVSSAFPAAPAIGDLYDIARAPITFTNMAQSFADNIGANTGVAEVFPSVMVAASDGSVPNNYNIDLALTTSAFVYDPTTMGNLVIEVSCAAAPAPNPAQLIPFSTSSVAATHRARRNSQNSAAATVGALSDFASVVRLDFTGPGGFSSIVPATVFSYGAGCGAQSTGFYQAFGAEDFDLRGNPANSLLLTPNTLVAPTHYNVTAGTTAVDLSQAVGPVEATDEGVVTHNPGWAAPFAFPGGTTSDLRASANGFVWMGASVAADPSPTVGELLGGGASNLPARVAPFWHDWDGSRNVATHPGSGMYVNTDTSGGAGNFVTYVTWKETGEFNTVAAGGQSVNTFQCVFSEATGEIEFRYGTMTGVRWGTGITGFSQGSLGGGVNSVNPGSRDLSVEVPFSTTGPNGPGTNSVLLQISARPIVNTSVTFTASNLPATTQWGAVMWTVPTLTPGVTFPPLAPNCIASVVPLPITHELHLLPTSPITSAPFGPLPLAFMGTVVGFQYATFDSSGAVFSSNGLKLTLGLN